MSENNINSNIETEKIEDYYAELGIPQFTSKITKIRSAYLEQATFFDPEKHNVTEEIATAKTERLTRIYDTLSNRRKKRAYDKRLYRFLEKEEHGRPYRKYRNLKRMIRVSKRIF